MNFAGQSIVVVGANGDIGRAVSERLSSTEAQDVHLLSREGCDVTSTASVRDAMARVWAASSRIDGVVCCHGAPGLIKPSLEVTDDELRNVLEIDLIGSFRVAREAMRYMGPQGHGSIVFVSSYHAVATYPQRAAYAAAKAGVCGLMRALAVEWACRGVSVNAILPGQVWGTKRTKPHESSQRASERSPSGAFVDVQCIAQAICFLLASDGINGHTLVVDDGWTASAWYGAHDVT